MVVRIEQPVPPQIAAVALYASGKRAEAIAMLEGWGEADMKNELVALRALKNEMGGRLPEDLLRAAVMLHTDRDEHERMQVPMDERMRTCGTDEHAEFARALVGLLIVHSDASRDFARRWFVAVALASHRDLCLDDVRKWAQEGLKLFPKDPQLLLIHGTASEVSISMTAAVERFLNPSRRGEGAREAVRRRNDVAGARRDFEAALAADPGLHEARLRLGRVLWRTGKPQEARAALQDLVQRSPDAWILYLGHLFLGRVLEGLGDVPGAIEQYRAALAVDPSAQAAAVALSEALLMSGEEDESRRVLNLALMQAPRGQPRDAFMSYHHGRAGLAEDLLDDLRRETLE